VKIVFTGPECTGKTSIAQIIGQRYNFCYIPEMAREYLDLRHNTYNEQSLNEIALLQLWAEKTGKENYHSLCCDTDLLTILIWQNEKYGYTDQDLMKKWLQSTVDLFFLCTPDFPWEYDSQRENPEDRQRLFDIYFDILTHSNHPFHVLTGPLEQRILDVERILTPLIFLASDIDE